MTVRNEKQRKLLREIERRLRRLESALRFRVPRYEIKPTPHFYRQFPSARGRKFFLVRWIDDKRITVLDSATRTPHRYAASYFQLS